MSERTERIRALNDAFRITLHGGRVMMTPGVAALPYPDQTAIIDRVRTFSEFSEENDPYGEHDFVSLHYAGVTYFGKIDYFDLQMECASEDPSDPLTTIRVLTIMRADEY